ncbi:hypothetical protein Bca52824_034219 [Brassica carinata]|uniref:AIPP2-like SPOC-like domain-containing protein n=1 Tax=Brassica carinata TaxID=52824 RepID=A0A8X7SG22_BRACI|nr:hypothetical protein Bca52824_034219 [Brassica carinata]
MSPSQGKLPSNSIRVVPGRSKLRVESSNPVARGNPIPRTSKVKPLTTEEAIKLHSGVSQGPVRPPSESSRYYKPAFESRLEPVPATFESQRREPVRPPLESSRREPVPATFEESRHFLAGRTPEAPRHVPARPTYQPPRPVSARPNDEPPRHVPNRPTYIPPRPVSARTNYEPPRHVPARPAYKPPRPVPPRPTSKPPRPVPARPAAGFRKEIVCGLRAASSMSTTTVRRRTNPRSLHQPRTVELPPSPSALQIPSKVQQQATTDATTHIIDETVVEAGDKAEDHGSKETCRSASEERISESRLYGPALLPTWKGRIVDSATLPEFDCQFWANPASFISRKALRLSKAMPIFLEVELVPTGHILNDLFGRIPKLSDVQLYFFLDEKETERSKREHAHLFETMATRNAMMKASVNGAELLIFSSKLLDKTSQLFIKKQTKIENYLWGFFLHYKNTQEAHALDDGNVVDMDIDPEDQAPGPTLQPIAESQSTSSSSQWKVNRDVRLPLGFEKIWTPPSSRPCGSSRERPSCS